MRFLFSKKFYFIKNYFFLNCTAIDPTAPIANANVAPIIASPTPHNAENNTPLIPGIFPKYVDAKTDSGGLNRSIVIILLTIRIPTAAFIIVKIMLDTKNANALEDPHSVGSKLYFFDPLAPILKYKIM